MKPGKSPYNTRHLNTDGSKHDPLLPQLSLLPNDPSTELADTVGAAI